MDSFCIGMDHLSKVLIALEDMDKEEAWSALILAGMIKSGLSNQCKLTHGMTIKWPVTGGATKINMTLECGPEMEITAGDFKPNAER